MAKNSLAKPTNVMNIDEYHRMAEVEDNHWWYRGLRRIFNNLLKDYAPKTPLKILDAGCGTGGNLQMLEQFGEVIACDISPEAAKICRERRGKEVTMTPIVKMPFKDSSFDIITSFDVIYCLDKKEHGKVFKEFWRILRPGGLLYLNVPAYNWLHSNHDDFIGTKHRFLLKEIRRLAKSNGFVTEKLSYWNSILFPVAVIVRFLKKRWFKSKAESDLKPVGKITNQLLATVLLLEAQLLKFIKFPFGLSILAVVRKKAK